MIGVRARRAMCLVVVLWVAGLTAAPVASAEDGYDLWLRYRPVEQSWGDRYRAALTQLVAGSASPTLQVAFAELQRGLQGLLGVTLTATQESNIFWLSLLIVPGFVFATGIYTWWRRR